MPQPKCHSWLDRIIYIWIQYENKKKHIKKKTISAFAVCDLQRPAGASCNGGLMCCSSGGSCWVSLCRVLCSSSTHALATTHSPRGWSIIICSAWACSNTSHLPILWMEMFLSAPCHLLSTGHETPALQGEQRSKEGSVQQFPPWLQSQCWWHLKVSEGNICLLSLSLQTTVVPDLQHIMASPLTMPGQSLGAGQSISPGLSHPNNVPCMQSSAGELVPATGTSATMAVSKQGWFIAQVWGLGRAEPWSNHLRWHQLIRSSHLIRHFLAPISEHLLIFLCRWTVNSPFNTPVKMFPLGTTHLCCCFWEAQRHMPKFLACWLLHAFFF